MMRAGIVTLLILLLGGLPGCALMQLGEKLGAEKPPVFTYDLTAPPRVSSGARRIDQQILINSPSAVRALDTDRVLVRLAIGQINYFPEAVWSDTLPRLLQHRLVESFDNARIARAVGARSERISGDFAISTNIRAFQINVHNGRALAKIHLFVKIVDDNGGRVLASKDFTVTTPAAADSAEAGVIALNAAFHAIATKIIRWVARQPLA